MRNTAEVQRGRVCVCWGGGLSQASVLEPWSLPHQVAVVFLDLVDTGHQLGETSALTLPSTLENIPPEGGGTGWTGTLRERSRQMFG